MGGRTPRALTGIATALTRLADKGRLNPDAAQATIARIRAAVGLADLRDAGLVIEAVAERLDIKQKIFGDLEDIVAEQCILATITSSISVTAIGASMRNPARLVGMHVPPLPSNGAGGSGQRTGNLEGDSAARLSDGRSLGARHRFTRNRRRGSLLTAWRGRFMRKACVC